MNRHSKFGKRKAVETQVSIGGMLSVDKTMPAIVLRMHHILPFLTTASTGVTLFVLK